MKKIYIAILFSIFLNVSNAQLDLKLVINGNTVSVFLQGPYNATFGTLNFDISKNPGVNITLDQNPYVASLFTSGNTVSFVYSDVSIPIPVVDFNTPQLIATMLVSGPSPSGISILLNESLYAEIGSDDFAFNGAAQGANDLNATVLPIRLQSFTAQKLNYNSSLLNWKSLSEENASHFDIEKSLDAENWVKVGTERTRGSLNYGAEYSFVDENAVVLRNDDNTAYYRLKMVDNDGSFQYSDVRLVTFERSLTDVEVYPNPSHEFFNWKMGVGDTQVYDAQLQLFDMTGKLVKKQTVSANGISKVDIAELETGLYNVVVKHEDKIYRKRIIKTN